MACRGSGVRVPPAPPTFIGQAQVVPRRAPSSWRRRGRCLSGAEQMITTGSGEAKTTRDGRRWTLRPARPTDGRALARLFSDVRKEGRWLITAPGAVSEPSEAFWIAEMIRAAEHLTMVAEAGGEVVGNILVSVDRGVATEHIGVLSITIAADWRDVGI